MHELVPLRINLLECFTAALRKDEVARVAVAGFDRLVPIGTNVFAVVAAETPVPIFVFFGFLFRGRSDCLLIACATVNSSGGKRSRKNQHQESARGGFHNIQINI